jgi:hypothetical protein
LPTGILEEMQMSASPVSPDDSSPASKPDPVPTVDLLNQPSLSQSPTSVHDDSIPDTLRTRTDLPTIPGWGPF